jgi:hypothetical protein
VTERPDWPERPGEREERPGRPGHGVLLILGGIPVALVASAGGTVGAVVTAGAVLLLALLVPSRWLLATLVLAQYVTRFRIPVAGARLLPEQVLVMACLVRAIGGGRSADLLAGARHRTVQLMGLFVAWSAVVSLLRSPAPAKSLAVSAWLGFSWLILVVLAGLAPSTAWLQRQLVAGAAAAAACAIALFAAARTLGISYGLQVEYVTGAQAEYGLAWEANILGSTLAVALFIAATAPDRTIPRTVRRFVVPLLLVALLLTLTRGAVVGLIVGGIAWAGLSPRLAWRRLGPAVAVTACVLAGLVSLSPSTATPVAIKLGALVDASSSTGAFRVQTWNDAVADVRNAGATGALVGLGVNSFGQRHLDQSRPTQDLPAYLGNVVLQILYDTGLVGAALLVAALASCWPAGSDGRRRALGLLLVVLVSSAATSTFWFGSTWSLIALAVLGSTRRPPAPGHEPLDEAVPVAEPVPGPDVAIQGRTPR